MPYNRAQLLQAVRSDHPEFSGVNDIELYKALATDHPELVKGTENVIPDIPQGPDSRTAGEVLSDRAANVLTGAGKAITGIPGFISSVLRAKTPQDTRELIKGAVQPIGNMLHSVAAAAQGLYADPETEHKGFDISAGMPEDPRSAQAAETAGGNLVGLELPNALSALGVAAKSAIPANAAERLQAMASANKARALDPRTIQGKMDAGNIAQEMSQYGDAKGYFSKSIDKSILNQAEGAGKQVHAVEDRLNQDARPEYQTDRDSILKEIDAAQHALNVPRTGVSMRPEAQAQLQQVRDIVAKMPKFMDFDQTIALRRQLDARASEVGAYGTGADTLRSDISRGVADVVRGKLNALDPELASANHDYSVARKAADIVNDRQLRDTGKIANGLPGHGGVLDDVLASWAGHAMGGTVGGVAAEALNLGRQTRGWANVKSGTQQYLADALAKPAPGPAGLLEAGTVIPPQTIANPKFKMTADDWFRQKQLPPGPADTTHVKVTGTIQRPSGQVYEMPPSIRALIPEYASGPAKELAGPATKFLKGQFTGPDTVRLQPLVGGRAVDLNTGKFYQLQPDGKYTAITEPLQFGSQLTDALRKAADSGRQSPGGAPNLKNGANQYFADALQKLQNKRP